MQKRMTEKHTRIGHWLYVRNETVIGLDYLCVFLLSEYIHFHCKAVNIIKIFLSTKAV